MMLAADSHLALDATAAVQAGDVDRLSQLLGDHPGLADARIGSADFSRTLLHAATDWPGHFPEGPAVVRTLVEHGADVDARFVGPHQETPLHWAASSDDVAVLDALLDLGAHIEAPGAVLGGGSPLADACGFGNWAAARRLVERGARTRLKDAAALGLLDRVQAMLATDGPAGEEEVTRALWSACHGGQLAAARLLLDRGADVDWLGWDGLTPLDVARRGGANDVVTWLEGLGARSAREAPPAG